MPHTIRLAVPSDFPVLMSLRLALFEELGHPLSAADRAQITAEHARWFSEHEGRVVTWLAELDGAAVACGSLALLDRLPYPGHAKGLDAYLQNMYTLRQARGMGVGRAIVGAAKAWAVQHGVGMIMLHASADGEPLYRQCGFVPSGSYLEWRNPSA